MINKNQKNYKGLPLLDTLYKVYASKLAKRLTEDLRAKEIILYNFAELSDKAGVLDNMECLKHMIDKKNQKESSKILYCSQIIGGRHGEPETTMGNHRKKDITI